MSTEQAKGWSVARSDAGNVSVQFADPSKTITFECTMEEAAALCAELLRVLAEQHMATAKERFKAGCSKHGHDVDTSCDDCLRLAATWLDLMALQEREDVRRLNDCVMPALKDPKLAEELRALERSKR